MADPTNAAQLDVGAQFASVVQAPVPFFLAVFALAGLAWVAIWRMMEARYGGTISAQKERIALRAEQLAALRDKIENAPSDEAAIVAAKAELAKQERLLDKQQSPPRGRPDMTIRELFFHIDPNVLGDDRWKSVGRDVQDAFSTGQIDCWGRRIRGIGGRGPLEQIEPKFWSGARFTYWFFKDDGEQNDHVRKSTIMENIEYADLRVDRSQALAIWPGRA